MLDEILQLHTLDRLKTRLALLRTDEKPKRKPEIIDLIRRHLLSEHCRDYWQELDELEKQAVGEVVHNWNGSFDAARFRAKYDQLPKYLEPREPMYGLRLEKPERSFLPLFFYNRAIPDDLCRQLAAFVPKPVSDALRTLTEDSLPREFETEGGQRYPVSVLAMEAVAFQDLASVLNLVAEGALRVSDKTSLPGAASLRRIEDVLMGGDYYSPDQELNLERWDGGLIRPIRPFAWPLLLQSGGLAKRNGTKLELTQKGKKSLVEPPQETIKRLYERWRSKGMLDEYRRIDQVKGQTGKGRRMTAPPPRRLAVQVALKECPTGAWIQVEEFFRYLQSVGHDFEVAQDLWKLYVVDNNYGNLGYEGFGDFNILQGRYILVYLFEYLATLGLIDIAYVPPYGVMDDFRDIWGTDDLAFFSRYDGLLYFRLNPLGAYCLGLSDQYRPTVAPTPPLLAVDTDLLITALRKVEPGERMILDRYAEGLGPETWRLSAEAMLEAMADGHDPELFRHFLHEQAEGGLPAEVDQLFEAAGERLSALSDAGPARLLRCSSQAMAEMLAVDPHTGAHCLRAGGPMLAVPQGKEKAFRSGLRRLGYVFPKT